LNEFEKTNSSHDIGRSVKGNFVKCLWLPEIRQSVASYTCLGVYSSGTGRGNWGGNNE